MRVRAASKGPNPVSRCGACYTKDFAGGGIMRLAGLGWAWGRDFGGKVYES